MADTALISTPPLYAPKGRRQKTAMQQQIKLSLLQNNSGQIPGVKQNPRDLSTEGFELAKSSIQDFPEMLDVRTLVVIPYKDNYIVIGGNQRLKALKALGYTEAPCNIVNWDSNQINEFIIKDNLEYGNWDFKLLSNDWDLDQLNEWGLEIPEDFNIELEEVEGLTDEDQVPEVLEGPKTKLGDIWILGNHRLMCGDSTMIDDVEKLMDGEKADLVWTDPPYNVAIDGKAGKILNDNMSDSSFKQFMSAVYTNYYCVMRDGAVIYVAHAESERVTFTEEFVKSGLKLSQVLIWAKHSATLSRQDFNWRHEPIIYGWKEGAAHYYCEDYTNNTVIDESNDDIDYKKMDKPKLIAEIRKLKQKPDGSTVIKYDRPTISDLHPTMKPVGLVEMMIGWSSKPGWIVLDLFGGSGSTLIACQKINRSARLMEFDPKFVDVIIKRWQDFTGENAICSSTGQKFNEL